MKRVTSDFLQRATSATSNERILQRVMSGFLQRAASATSNDRILQRVTSGFLQRATPARSNEQILQRVASDFTTTNEQRVKNYASFATLYCHQYIYHSVVLAKSYDFTRYRAMFF